MSLNPEVTLSSSLRPGSSPGCFSVFRRIVGVALTLHARSSTNAKFYGEIGGDEFQIEGSLHIRRFWNWLGGIDVPLRHYFLSQPVPVTLESAATTHGSTPVRDSSVT